MSCNKKLTFPSDPTLYLGLQCALVTSNIYVFQCNVHSRVHPVGLWQVSGSYFLFSVAYCGGSMDWMSLTSYLNGLK